MGIDVMMGQMVIWFEPTEVTIAAGESIHFINNMLHIMLLLKISRLGLAMFAGEDFEVAFSEAGDILIGVVLIKERE